MMGKINVRGKARRELKADSMQVRITVSTEGETSALAISKGKKETEKVLKLLLELGIKLDDVTMESDEAMKPNRYNDDKFYRFEKEISFISSANLAVLETVSDGIIKNEINATYDETFYLSNYETAKKEVMKEALLDSKKQAEIIAETLNQKVVSIESANCDEYSEPMFKEKECCIRESSGTSNLAAMLSPDTIVVDENIDVVWIIE